MFMLLQKNTNINVLTYQELKSDLEDNEKKGDDDQPEAKQEMKWRPAKNAKEFRKIVPLFQVIYGMDITLRNTFALIGGGNNAVC